MKKSYILSLLLLGLSSFCIYSMDLDPDLRNQEDQTQLRQVERQPSSVSRIISSITEVLGETITDERYREMLFETIEEFGVGNAYRAVRALSNRPQIQVRWEPGSINWSTLFSRNVQNVIEYLRVQPNYKTLISSLSHPSESVFKFNDNGSKILSVFNGSSVDTWNIQRAQRIKSVLLTAILFDFYAVFSPDGKRILTINGLGHQRLMRLWDIETGNKLKELELVTHNVFRMPVLSNLCDCNTAVFSPDNNKILTLFTDGVIQIWNADMSQVLQEIRDRADSPSYAIEIVKAEFSPDNTKIMTIYQKRPTTSSVRTFSNTNHRRLICDIQTNEEVQVHYIAYAVKIWDAQTGQLLRVLRHIDRIKDAIFSPDGKMIATISGDIVSVWCVETGRRLKEFSRRFVQNVKFSSDGRKIIVACPFDVYIYSVESRQLLHEFRGTMLAMSSDGEKILSYAGSNIVGVYNVETGQLLQKFEGYTHPVAKAIFSPDSTAAVTVSTDGTVRRLVIGNKEQTLQWLTNTLPDQELFLSSDQAEIICKMYDAYNNGTRLKVTNSEMDIFNEMPVYVRNWLTSYFGKLKLLNNSEEPLHNSQQEEPLSNDSVVNDSLVEVPLHNNSIEEAQDTQQESLSNSSVPNNDQIATPVDNQEDTAGCKIL